MLLPRAAATALREGRNPAGEPRDKLYFDGSDPRYLQVIRAVEDSYIGKAVDAGTAAVTMDDLKRNILSILTRIAPGRHLARRRYEPAGAI